MRNTLQIEIQIEIRGLKIPAAPPNNINVPNFFKNEVKVKYCDTSISANNDIYGLKHLNRIDSVIASSEIDEDNLFEGIFLDNENFVIEGIMTNIFFVKNQTLFTPPISQMGIEGIMRQVILEKAINFFKKVVIKKIHKSDVSSFDEMFLVNSVLKVVPVNKIGIKKFIFSNNTKKLIEYFNNQKNKIENLEFA